MDQDIASIRRKIDTIDGQLLGLLNERAKLVLEIGKLKKARDLSVYAPDREQEIHQRIQHLNPGPLSNEAIHRLFKEIIRESRKLEQEITFGP